MPCVSASGDQMTPLAIFEGKSIDSGYLQTDFDCLTASNENAYMTKRFFEIGVNILLIFVNQQYMYQHFL